MRPSLVIVMSLDAVAVEVVVEAPAACADSQAARAALSEAFRDVRAPRRGPQGGHWTVTLSWSGTSPGAAAEGTIFDDAGGRVAERVLHGGVGTTCAGVGRAVAAWASLVVDAELARESAGASTPPNGAPPPSSTSPAPGVAVETRAAGPAPSDADTRAPEGRAPAVDLGAAAALRTGMGVGTVVAFSPYVAFSVGEALWLRPSLSMGSSLERQTMGNGSGLVGFVDARLDLCRRVEGNYSPRKGLELDVCGGVEGGVSATVDAHAQGPCTSDCSTTSGVAPRLSVGPAVILRGALTRLLNVELRGVAGANVLRAGLPPDPNATRPPPFGAATEVGLGVRLP